MTKSDALKLAKLCILLAGATLVMMAAVDYFTMLLS
jgi:hypothetical protein